MKDFKVRAWLIKEKRMVFPSTINFNKGYGTALEIFVDNPEFKPHKHIIEEPESNVLPFFTYINHSIPAHIERSKGDDFILMLRSNKKDDLGDYIYDGDIVQYVRKNWTPTGHSKDGSTLVSHSEVYWSEEFNSFRHRGDVADNKGFVDGWLTFNDTRAEKIEILRVGNIYENPDLLKLTKTN